MGIYSTRTVNRELALSTLTKKLYAASNDELAKMLDVAIGEDTLNNFIVTDAEYLTICGYCYHGQGGQHEKNCYYKDGNGSDMYAPDSTPLKINLAEWSKDENGRWGLIGFEQSYDE